MTTRHSTSKGCPRSPRRDATERNKAEQSPWTLSGAASALADCPRTARRKATREGRAKALSAGQCDESASCRAAGVVVILAPLSAQTRLVLETNKQRGARLEVPSSQAHYSDRRVVTSVGPALRRAQQVHNFDRSRQGRNRRITLWPNPLTRPKPRGLMSGTTIRDTLIGELRPLQNANTC